MSQDLPGIILCYTRKEVFCCWVFLEVWVFGVFLGGGGGVFCFVLNHNSNILNNI